MDIFKYTHVHNIRMRFFSYLIKTREIAIYKITEQFQCLFKHDDASLLCIRLN